MNGIPKVYILIMVYHICDKMKCKKCGGQLKKLYYRQNIPKRKWVVVSSFKHCENCGCVPAWYIIIIAT